jgi:uncharacterized membrane protein YfcA
MIRLCHLVSCIQTAATAGFRPFTTILSRSSFCTLHPIYTIQRLFFFTLPSSSLVSFFKKKLILTDCFFSVGLFVRVCFFVSTAAAAAAPTAFLFRLQSVWMYVCMYVRMYEKKNETRNMMMKDEEKKEIENSNFIMIIVIIIVVVVKLNIKCY